MTGGGILKPQLLDEYQKDSQCRRHSHAEARRRRGLHHVLSEIVLNMLIIQ